MSASILNQAAVSQLLKPFGFNSLEQVDACRNIQDYLAQLKRVSTRDASGHAYAHLEGRKVESFRHLKLLAEVLKGQQRDLVGRHEPTARMLRDFGPRRPGRRDGVAADAVRHLLPAVAADPSSDFAVDIPDDLAATGTTPLQFAQPGSIQSSLSPAAYLKHLYDLANDISNGTPALNLAQRRPDLANLALSEANLNTELPTLDLANEVLLAQVIAAEQSGTTEAAIDAALTTALYPFALPFDRAHSQVRHGLAAMHASSLNALARDLRQQAYALGDTDFSLVPNVLDALHLYQGHLAVLAVATPSSTDTLATEWYGVSADTDLNNVTDFQAATGLSPEQFSALYCIDPVYDATGAAHASDQGMARYISNYQYRLSFQITNGQQAMCFVDGSGSSQALNASILANLNRMIRLQQRTGLGYAELDWLLQSVQPLQTDPGQLSETGGLDLIARYLYWRQRYGLGADEFVGMLTEISGQYRLGQPNTSLLATLFGTAAGVIAALMEQDATDLQDLPLNVQQALMVGLRLPFADYDALVGALTRADAPASAAFNKAMLSRMYRIVRLCQLFDWPVSSTLQLLSPLGLGPLLKQTGDSQASLTTILNQLDTLSWLDDWLKDAGNKLTIDSLLTILTPASALTSGPEVTVAAQTFTNTLSQGLATKTITAQSFAAAETWSVSGGSGTTPTTQNYRIPAATWITNLSTQQIIDANGLVTANSADAICSAVETLVAATIGSGATLTPSAQAQQQQLIKLLRDAQSGQLGVLCKAIGQYTGIKSGLAAPLLAWMGMTADQVMSDFSATTATSGASVPGALDAQCLGTLYEIDRHAAVVSALDLDGPMILLAAQNSGWLRTGLANTMGLEQVYWLQRLKALTWGKITSVHWILYLARADSSEQGIALATTADQNWYLSRFLDWPSDDLGNLTGNGSDIGITGGLITTVQQLDYLRRRIDVCRGLHLRAAELQDLDAVNSANTPDFASAAVATELALQRLDDSTPTTIAQGTSAQEYRDALLAAFFTQVVAGSSFLPQSIQTADDVYQYLLLDVNVAYEVPTTRLLEAIGSIQLYINRIIAQVETGNYAGGMELLKTLWETSQHYRLWQANEELALYPSSYIDPTLRLGKTQLFTQLEQALQPNALSAAGVQRAVVQYINGLSQLAGLEVSGYTVEHGTASMTFCFTAKANWLQNAYYYRALQVDYGALKLQSPFAYTWSDWRRANVPFSSQRVFGIAPCYGWGRLHLFWLEVFKTSSSATGTSASYSVTPQYYLQLKYCRQNSDGSFGQPFTSSVADSPNGILLNGATDGNIDQLEVQLYQAFFSAGDTDPSSSQIVLEFKVQTASNPAGTIYQAVSFARRSTVTQSADQNQPTTVAFSCGGYGATSPVLTPSADPLRVQMVEPLPCLTTSAHIPDAALNMWFCMASHDLTYGYWPAPNQTESYDSIPYLAFSVSPPAAGATNLGLNSALTLLNCAWSGINVAVYADNQTTANAYFAYQETDFSIAIGNNPGTTTYRLGTQPTSNQYFVDIGSGEWPARQLEAGSSAGSCMDSQPVQLLSPSFQLAVPSQPYTELTATLTAQTTWQISHSSDISALPMGTFESDVKTITVPLNLIDISAFKVEVLAADQAPEQSFLLFQPPCAGETVTPLATTALYSTAIEQVVRLVNPEYDIQDLYTVANQGFPEQGVSDFLSAVQETYPLTPPLPRAVMDFSGCYGLYAWELFYYIPMLIAAKYTKAGDFDQAKQWLQRVYDPTAAGAWNCRPLMPGNAPSSPVLAQSGITDPDLIARQNPEHYRLATIQQYLQNLISQGDAYYRQLTTETLRQAKMCYVEALSLFTQQQSAFQGEAEQWVAKGTPVPEPVLVFDGSTTYIETPYASQLNPAQFTLSCWVRAQSLASPRWQTIVSSRLNANMVAVAGYALQLSDVNHWYFECDTSSGQPSSITFEPADLEQWTHLAATFDGSTVTLYVNGDQAGTISCSGFKPNQSAPFRIGNSNPGDTSGARFFAGAIAQVRLWNTAQTQQQILADMSSDSPILVQHLVSWWPLNDGEKAAGGVVAQSGNARYRSVIAGTPSWSMEAVPWSPASSAPALATTPTTLITAPAERWLLNLDGQSNFVSVPFSAALNPPQFTLSCWVYVTQLGHWQTIVDSRGDRSGEGRFSAGYTLQIGPGCNFYFQCNDSNTDSIADGTKVEPANWTYLAATYDGETMQLYVNGEPTTSGSLPSFTPVTDSTIDLRFGVTTTEYFNGQIANVRIYNSALSPAQILEDQAGASSAASDRLVGFWPLNDGAGATRIADVSGNGHDGTLKGTVGAGTWIKTAAPLPPAPQPTSAPPSDPTAWWAPTLGAVTKDDFLLPRNQALLDLYDGLQQRLYNLRHWLSIDGTPLNIPLIAAPINPRELQLAALAGLSPAQSQQAKPTVPQHSFDDLLSRAKGYVENLISWSDHLLRFQRDADERALAGTISSLETGILQLVSEQQQHRIELAQKAVEVKQKAKDQTKHEMDFYIADIPIAEAESALLEAMSIDKAGLRVYEMAMTEIKSGMRLIPNIFGLADGGSDFGALAAGQADLAKVGVEEDDSVMELLKGIYDLERTIRFGSKKVASFASNIDQIDIEIDIAQGEVEHEQQTLASIQQQIQNKQALARFNATRFTSETFWSWYLDNLKELYQTYFDQTVSFCLLAEQAYQAETQSKAQYIFPQWDASNAGLLSGHKLLLDLQRMELAWAQQVASTAQQTTQSFSLRERAPTALSELKRRGKTLVHLEEPWLDELFPDERGRRLHSLALGFRGLDDADPIAAHFSQLWHRQRLDDGQGYGPETFAAQPPLRLTAALTDTAKIEVPKGRLLPLQGSGIDSTWLLSFPAAVKAIEAGAREHRQQAMLDRLDDVVLTLRYTSRQ